MLRQSSPELFKNIRLLQVGRVDEGWFRALLRKYALFELCTMHGFQDRRRSIEMLSEASLFYFGLASTKERGIVPSRLFDLFASGRPILAALPSGSVVAELIAEIDNGCPFDSDDSADVRKAADFIGRLARQHLSGEMSLIVRPEYASRFSASAMAARFAEVIRNL
jgi:glycosyltransferase involved in cell wall biosynthesis